MISMIPLPYRILALVILVLGVAAVSYNRGHSHGSASVQQQWDADRVAMANNVAKAVAEAQEKAERERLALFQQGQEAVKNAAIEMAKAKQNAQAWEQRYRQALQTPECERWSKEFVQCPLR